MQTDFSAFVQDDETHVLLADLLALHAAVSTEARATIATWRPAIVREEFLGSAENLAHYLALRKADIRPVQERLSRLGLSSLGRSEAHVMASIEAVIATLSRLAASWPVDRPDHRSFVKADTLLAERQSAIFGRDPKGPRTRIMVTLPADAANDPGLARRLIESGADVARINCAHDDAETWARMIGHVRTAAAALSRDVRVLMDLGGPKIRIGEVNGASRGRLYRGDRFILSAALSGNDIMPEATLAPALLLDVLKAGQNVWINDGKIGAKVIGLDRGMATLEVFSAREKGEKLKPQKGVNLPGEHHPHRQCLTPRGRLPCQFPAL